jgi:hypothetical protein
MTPPQTTTTREAVLEGLASFNSEKLHRKKKADDVTDFLKTLLFSEKQTS